MNRLLIRGISVGMRTLLLLVGCLAFLRWEAVSGAEAATELDPKKAVKLISLILEVREDPIEVAAIIDGNKKRDGGFEGTEVKRVVSVHPVDLDGRRVRMVRCYDFFWNADYGWFTWESRPERGGEAVYLWSELRGALVIK